MTDQISCTKKILYDIQQKWGTSDIYRDTPIRFLGYANEVGEAFRALVPLNAVRLSYVIATSYVIADSMDKSHSAYKRAYLSREERQRQVAISLLDTLAWQGLASVIIPGITINRLCAFTTAIFRRTTQIAPAPIKLWTTAIGLCTIPFIVKPIDSCVEVGMNKFLRPYYINSKPRILD